MHGDIFTFNTCKKKPLPEFTFARNEIDLFYFILDLTSGVLFSACH